MKKTVAIFALFVISILPIFQFIANANDSSNGGFMLDGLNFDVNINQGGGLSDPV